MTAKIHVCYVVHVRCTPKKGGYENVLYAVWGGYKTFLKGLFGRFNVHNLHNLHKQMNGGSLEGLKTIKMQGFLCTSCMFMYKCCDYRRDLPWGVLRGRAKWA